MRTFDASLPAVGFWLAVVLPPAVFLLLIQVWANGIQRGEIGLTGFLWLAALAQLLPLAALAWTLLSTAAYSIAPDKLIVHRVMFDREFSFATLTEAPSLRNGVITLRLSRPVRLRVAEPQLCMDALRQMLENSPSIRDDSRNRERVYFGVTIAARSSEKSGVDRASAPSRVVDAVRPTE